MTFKPLPPAQAMSAISKAPRNKNITARGSMPKKIQQFRRGVKIKHPSTNLQHPEKLQKGMTRLRLISMRQARASREANMAYDQSGAVGKHPSVIWAWRGQNRRRAAALVPIFLWGDCVPSAKRCDKMTACFKP